MKQKLSLAAGLMHRPKLFFLDEPTTGVDPVSRREFWQMLYNLNRDGMTIVVSTPYMDEAELCTRVAFINHGKIITCDSPKKLKVDYPYRLLELTVPSKSVRQHLVECPEIIDINAFGEKYHLVVNNPDEATPIVREVLKKVGLPVFSMREILPTMEDIFVALAEEVNPS
jgi:ABC-2 type transport system ATP-binding protein